MLSSNSQQLLFDSSGKIESFTAQARLPDQLSTSFSLEVKGLCEEEALSYTPSKELLSNFDSAQVFELYRSFRVVLLEQAYNSVLPEDEDHICLCFGVTKSQVESFINSKKGSLVSLDITAEMLAGGGCTSCQKDLSGQIESYQLAHRIIPGGVSCSSRTSADGRRLKLQGHSLSHWVNELDLFLEEHYQYSKYAQIEDISGFEVSVSFRDDNSHVDELALWSEEFKKLFGVSFHFVQTDAI
jgi:bacterioferritin-associated ferredoxin